MAELFTPLPEISFTAGEQQLLSEFLDYYRTVFLRKIEGLDDEQARVRLAPSTMDLLGMTRHLADVERWWFRGVYTAEVTTAIYESDDDPDLDWHHSQGDTLAEALGHWNDEVSRARQITAAARDLGQLGALTTGRRGEISLRWILVHMIEEYARHCGHADFLREAIDGRVGD